MILQVSLDCSPNNDLTKDSLMWECCNSEPALDELDKPGSLNGLPEATFAGRCPRARSHAGISMWLQAPNARLANGAGCSPSLPGATNATAQGPQM